MLGLLFFAGAIYDAEQKYTVETFFFEPDLKSNKRMLPPVSVDALSENTLRRRLIGRFMHEYFYVIPDVNNALMRSKFKNEDGTETALKVRSEQRVYKDWAENVAPEIIELAEQGVLRTVRVLPNITESKSGHLVVPYELRTWTKPNDVLAQPEVTTGELYLDIRKETITVIQTQDALDLLKKGTDPMAVFTFKVKGVTRK